MKKGDNVIMKSSGDEYVIFDCTEDEICILQFFPYAIYPYKRQLMIWQSKEQFIINNEDKNERIS